MTTDERRKAVMRAVITIEQEPMMKLVTGVRAFHIVYFGIEECVNLYLETIGRELVWLEKEGYVIRPNGRSAEFVSTEAGQRWARLEKEETDVRD